jgi:hypothetical protein
MIKYILINLVFWGFINISSGQLTEDRFLKLDSNFVEIKTQTLNNLLIDFLYFNNDQIFVVTEFPLNLSFHSHFIANDGEDIILIQETAASAAFYIILSIKNNNYWFSQEFGTTSDLPKLDFDGQQLIIDLPQRNGGFKKYIYKNRKFSFESFH